LKTKKIGKLKVNMRTRNGKHVNVVIKDI